VPRLSLPAITSALATPGSGLAIVSRKNDSHLPAIWLTSILCSRTSRSMSGLRPTVPMITTAAIGWPSVIKAGWSPVTRWTSA
jgi:hypothetical protein